MTLRALTLLAALILTASLATPREAPVPPGARPVVVASATSGPAPLGAPPSGANRAAATVVTSARDPFIGRGSPRHRSAPRGAETADGGAPPLDAITRQGIASHMGDAPVSPRYLALPMGPGWRVWLCGPAACDSIVSTDAGPSLAMQRAGRIADLSVPLFERFCGVSRTRGLCPITWTVERRPQVTLPPTDMP